MGKVGLKWDCLAHSHYLSLVFDATNEIAEIDRMDKKIGRTSGHVRALCGDLWTWY
jgi:hypothetical protein